MAWVLAVLLNLVPVVSESVLRSGRFWGVWLYFGLAVSALILEVLALVAGRWRVRSRKARRINFPIHR